VFEAWKHFAYGATLSTKIEIDEHDIAGAETAFVTFLTWYYKTVYQRKRKRLAACTYTMHALCHISICMKWWGPLSNVWQFAGERFCGLCVSRCKSRAYASSNIHQIIITHLGLQALMKTADSGIHLRNIRLHSPLDCLHHKMRLNLSFLSPKRFINDIGNTSAFDTEFLTAL